MDRTPTSGAFGSAMAHGLWWGRFAAWNRTVDLQFSWPGSNTILRISEIMKDFRACNSGISCVTPRKYVDERQSPEQKSHSASVETVGTM